MADNKRVCIIGAGNSGLSAIKCCLDEGLTPVCYERSEYIGGLWQYRDELHNGANVYKSTIINTSKEMMSWSDFPPPTEFANFMHNTKIIEYFNMYASHFELRKHININTEVVLCKKVIDHKVTGKWVVKIRSLLNNLEEDHIFDGVMICTGHHAVPNFQKQKFKVDSCKSEDPCKIDVPCKSDAPCKNHAPCKSDAQFKNDAVQK